VTRTASFITGSVLVASALALSGCKGAAPEASATKAQELIEIGRENVVEVKSQPITVGPLVSGELKAEREATVRAEIGGSVLQVFPREGESVAAGALLARIEGQPVHDAYASAQSALRSAEQTAEWAQKEAARIENLVGKAKDSARADIERYLRGLRWKAQPGNSNQESEPVMRDVRVAAPADRVSGDSQSLEIGLGDCSSL